MIDLVMGDEAMADEAWDIVALPHALWATA